MRLRLSVIVAAVLGCALSAQGAINYLDQITGASGTGSYLCSGGSACIDDFEINGIAGPGNGFVALTGVQAVITSSSGALPDAFRVNIYTNDGTLNNLRSQVQGDVFTQIFSIGDPGVTIQPYPVPGDNGNFPGSFLVTVHFDVNVAFGQYYLSVGAANVLGDAFFIRGSNNVTEGTPNNLVQVTNQGPGGNAQFVNDNAAFRVMGVPTPGAAGALVLAGLMAARRRRA